jgi:hypothetical protein
VAAMGILGILVLPAVAVVLLLSLLVRHL